MKSVQDQAAEDEDPVLLSTEDVWKPADTYRYTPTAVGNVRADVANSGAGKISVTVR
jgi:hypothetical protein